MVASSALSSSSLDPSLSRSPPAPRVAGLVTWLRFPGIIRNQAKHLEKKSQHL